MYEREAKFNAWIASFSPFPSYHLEGRQGCYQDWLDSRTGTTHHTVLPNCSPVGRELLTQEKLDMHVFSLFLTFSVAR